MHILGQLFAAAGFVEGRPVGRHHHASRYLASSQLRLFSSVGIRRPAKAGLADSLCGCSLLI
jgi:hypothetical protein